MGEKLIYLLILVFSKTMVLKAVMHYFLILSETHVTTGVQCFTSWYPFDKWYKAWR